MSDASHDGNVTAWRLQQLEDQIGKLVQALQSSTSTLGAQVTALSNQLGVGLSALPASYAPRPEAEARHKAIGERFEALDRLLADRERAMEERFEQRDNRLIERRDNVDRQFKYIEALVAANAARIERLERGAWAIASGILLALVGAVIAILKVNGGGA